MAHTLTILLADQEETTIKTIGVYLRALGHQVDEVTDGPAVLSTIETKGYDLVLISALLPVMDGLSVLARMRVLNPDMPSVLLVKYSTSELAIQALRLGVLDILTRPISLPALDTILEKVARDEAERKTSNGGNVVGPDIIDEPLYLVGISPAMDLVREQIQEIIENEGQSVLITGETGTGKEVVAREIHTQASSDGSPFVAVSCPTLTDSLVETELFGHVKGSYTGAGSDQAGYFEQAHGGTLFLDEIADFPTAVQATLLRVLETRTLRRVGGDRDIHINLRVITATNAPLIDMIESGRFRRDLYYRLNSYHIDLPPLRERPEDILPLAEYFISRFVRIHNLACKGISPEVQRLLPLNPYPGNARELRIIIERAVRRCGDELILPQHLNFLTDVPHSNHSDSTAHADESDPEKTRYLHTLDAVRWNRRQAAKTLGIPYWKLRYQLKKWGLA